MHMFRQADDLAVNRFLIEKGTVEFHMFLADHQGLTQSLAPPAPQAEPEQEIIDQASQGNLSEGDHEGNLPDLVGRKQFRRLLQFLNPFAAQTQSTENEEHGKRNQLDRRIQTTGQTSMSTER